MNLARKLSIIAVAMAALAITGKPADAGNIRGAVHVGKNVHVQFGRGAAHQGRPLLDHGHLRPIHPGHGQGWQHCPPPPPVCIYLVYYRDCHHGHWQVYGRYHSRHAAYAAASHLRRQGYQADVQRNHGIRGGGSFPAGSPHHGAPFRP